MATPVWYADWRFEEEEGTSLSETINHGIAPGTWNADLTGGNGALTDGEGALRIKVSGTYTPNNTAFWEPGETVVSSGTVYLTVDFRRYVLDPELPSGGFGELFRFSTNNLSSGRAAQVMFVLRRNGTTNQVDLQGYHSGTSTSTSGVFTPLHVLSDGPDLEDGLSICLEIDYTNRTYALHARVGTEAWRLNVGTGTLYSGAVLDGLRMQAANSYLHADDDAWIERISVSNVSPLDDGPDVIKVAEGTPYESPAYLIESGQPGPTAFIYGGLAQAVSGQVRETLGIVRQWPLEKGRVIFLPEYKVPDSDPARATLTTSFPRNAVEVPTNPAAAALWAYLSELQPDLMLELRSTTASPWRNTYGNFANVFLASGSQESVNFAAAMQARTDLNIASLNYTYERRVWPAAGLVARAAGDYLGVHAVNAYISSFNQGDVARRDQTVSMVYALLERAEMIPYGSVMTGLPPAVTRLRDHEKQARGKIAVAVYEGHGATGDGVLDVLRELKPRPETMVTLVTDQDIRMGVLQHFDAVVFSGGSGSSQGDSLDEVGRAAVRTFVEGGGGYLGICAGSYLALSDFSWGLGIINAKTKSPLWQRGEAIVEMELSAAGVELFGAQHATTAIQYANGPIIEPAGREDLPPYDVLAWFRTEVALNGTPPGIMVDSPAMVSAAYGAGRVVLFSPHPEKSLELSYMVTRAVTWAARVNLVPDPVLREEVIAAGTPYASTVTILDSGVPGPRVLVYGGIGQDLPAVAQAMQRIQGWEVQSGTVAFVPRFVIAADDPALTGLSTAFPRSFGQEPTNPAAAAWWNWAYDWMPDYSVELAETSSQPGSGNGNTVVSLSSAESTDAGISAKQRANLALDVVGQRFTRNSPPALGQLSRALGDIAATRSMITFVSSAAYGEATRTDLHLTLAYSLLERLGVVPYCSPLPHLPESVIARRQHAELGADKLRVAIYDGYGCLNSGVTNVALSVESRPDVYLAVLTNIDVYAGMLDHFDVVVFAGGIGGNQAISLGVRGREIVTDFLAQGGGYLGICAGGYLAMNNMSWGLKILNARTKSSLWARGEGNVEAQLTEEGRERLASGLDMMTVSYANGPVFEPAGLAEFPEYDVLAWYRTEMALNGTPVGIMVNSPAIVTAPFQKGRVVVSSPHPEASASLRHLVSGAINWAGFRDEVPNLWLAEGTPDDIGLPSADYELVMAAAGIGYGRPDAELVTVDWSQVDGPAGVTVAPGPADATLVGFPGDGDYTLRARARNRLGLESTLEVTVRVGGTGTVQVQPVELDLPTVLFAGVPAGFQLLGEGGTEWIQRAGPPITDLPAPSVTGGTLTFPDAGNYTLALRVEAADYRVYRRWPLAVSALDFGAWGAAFWPEGMRDPLDDADGNGRSNLLDFALLAAADAAPGAVLPAVARDGDGHVQFTFRRHRGPAGDPFAYAINGLLYEPVLSSDLREALTGSTAWEVVGVPTDNGDGTESITLRSRQPMDHGFAWLQVLLTEP